MEKYEINKQIAPYMPMALERAGCENYEVSRTKHNVRVTADSKRQIKKALIIAGSLKASNETRFPHLSRYEVNSSVNGAVGKDEMAYFFKAVL